MKAACFFLTLLSISFVARAQSKFSLEDFLKIVAQQHPTAVQISLLSNRAKQELQKAKGQFDPSINSYYDRKLFNESNYYDLFSAYVSVPTYYGLSVEAGFNHNTGDYLNPEDKTPYDGQAYLGLNVSLLQGLLTNERNTVLEQAKLLQNINAAQAQTLLNNLLYEAAYAYWDWAFAYNEVKIWQQAYQLSATRLEATKQAFLLGDKPAFDTLETYSNLLDRQLRWKEAELDLIQASLNLNNYLWENNQPMNLPPNYAPSALVDTVVLDSANLARTIEQLPANHPDLRLYGLQLEQLGIEQRLKQNKLLPKLELKYQFLAYNGLNFFPSSSFSMAENYKLGLKFSYAIPNRSYRADLQLNKIKINETQLKASQKRLEIANKLRNYQSEISNYFVQINLLQQNVSNYERLFAAELEKFRLGESSIFVLNSREIKLIETQQKLLSVLTKYQKAKAAFAWSAAQLAQ